MQQNEVETEKQQFDLNMWLQSCVLFFYGCFVTVKLFPVYFADAASNGNPYTKINKIESIHALDLTGVGVAAIVALLYLQFRKR